MGLREKLSGILSSNRRRRTLRTYNYKGEMWTYHGGWKKKFEKVNVKGRSNCDYGSGFYTALKKREAEDMILKKLNGRGILCTFRFHYADAKAAGLKILEFNTPDKEWLDFITKNRTIDDYEHGWDIVIGPTGDYKTDEVCAKYYAGLMSVEEAIEKINPYRYGTQVLFHTERSLDYLKEASDDRSQTFYPTN